MCVINVCLVSQAIGVSFFFLNFSFILSFKWSNQFILLFIWWCGLLYAKEVWIMVCYYWKYVKCFVWIFDSRLIFKQNTRQYFMVNKCCHKTGPSWCRKSTSMKLEFYMEITESFEHLLTKTYCLNILTTCKTEFPYTNTIITV